MVKVIEQTPEFIMVKELIEQLVVRADDEAHQESYELIYDILKIILDNFPTEKYV